MARSVFRTWFYSDLTRVFCLFFLFLFLIETNKALFFVLFFFFRVEGGT